MLHQRHGAGAYARPLVGDEGTDGVDAARIQHVPGLDPTAARRADAHAHLPAQALGEVAVAVDDQRGTTFDGLPGEMAVEVEMPGSAVHLDGSPAIAGRGEEVVPVEGVPVAAAGRPVR